MTRWRDWNAVSEERAEAAERLPLTDQHENWAGVAEPDTDACETDEQIERAIRAEDAVAEAVASTAMLEAMVAI